MVGLAALWAPLRHFKNVFELVWIFFHKQLTFVAAGTFLEKNAVQFIPFFHGKSEISEQRSA